MRRRTIFRTSFFFISLAFIIMLHQYIFYGKWFELKDIHHETFIIAFILIAIFPFLFMNFKRKKK